MPNFLLRLLGAATPGSSLCALQLSKVNCVPKPALLYLLGLLSSQYLLLVLTFLLQVLFSGPFVSEPDPSFRERYFPGTSLDPYETLARPTPARPTMYTPRSELFYGIHVENKFKNSYIQKCTLCTNQVF